MNLIERGENDWLYKEVQEENLLRYHSFLDTTIKAAIVTGQQRLSETLIKALNFHTIVALHPEAGRYRSVEVNAGDYDPPPHTEVPLMMGAFVQTVNEQWEKWDPTPLATHALWDINRIHPFVNGNGRTARAVCYFILCVKLGSPLPGSPTVPEMFGREPVRSTEYVQALKSADQGKFGDLGNLIDRLLTQQLQ